MKDMGKVMKSAKEKIGAQSDGKTINEVEEELIKILKLSSEVDESLFNLPADYEVIDMEDVEE